MSASMASCAARLICAGAGKSGKPCERLTALWRMARRVISRITDSVNCSALRESVGLVAAVRPSGAGFIVFLIKLAINFGVARNDFDVLARFGERNRVDEFGRLPVRLPLSPSDYAIFARIVRGERRFDTAKLLLQIREIRGAEPHI